MKQILIVTLILSFLFLLFSSCSPSPKNYDAFAQCLNEKEAKMYGAYWCPHCQDQKKEFGDSWKYINYTECSPPDSYQQTAPCQQAGIKGYPTWEFKNGERVSGKLSFEELSQRSGCEIS